MNNINFYQTLIRHTTIQVGKYLPDHCLTDNKKRDSRRLILASMHFMNGLMGSIQLDCEINDDRTMMSPKFIEEYTRNWKEHTVAEF
jgi:hypothetical protein